MLKYHFFRLRSILFHLFFVPLSVFSEAQNGLERKEMPLNAISGWKTGVLKVMNNNNTLI